jgi:hypothetical protein
MHLCGCTLAVLFGLTAFSFISAELTHANTTYTFESSLNRLLPRKGSSGGGRGGGGKGRGGTGGSSGSSSSSKVQTSSTLVRTATVSSSGGGSPLRLGPNTRFPGRWVGGGRRGDIYGSCRFGSGIKGTNGPREEPLTSSVQNANFPFGFWPVWFPHGYSGTSGYEYPSSTLNDTRPGEELVVVDVRPDPASVQVPDEEKNHTYYMFGDKDSVNIMMENLVLPKSQGGCNTINATTTNWTLSAVPMDRFELGHVIQWYRSSSFALAYTGYNNSYAYPPLNYTSPVNTSDPLPAALLTSEYLSCLNKTIGGTLPIMDAEAGKGLSENEIGAIIACSIIGSFVLIIVGLLCRCRWKEARRKRHERKDQFSWYKTHRNTLGNPSSHGASRFSNLWASPSSTYFRHSLSPTLSNISPLLTPASSQYELLGTGAKSLEPDKARQLRLES